MMNDDERFMRMALSEAREAYRAGEIPHRGRCGVQRESDRTRPQPHRVAVRRDRPCRDAGHHSRLTGPRGKYLTDCTLYVTVEPCLMCAGAIGWAQIPRIVTGAPDTKRGYTTFVARKPFHPRATLTEGVLADECAALMQAFFQERR